MEERERDWMFREAVLAFLGVGPTHHESRITSHGIYKEACDDEQRSACRGMFGEQFTERCGECPFFGSAAADPLEQRPDGAHQQEPEDDG
jgi:hypothetical protein